MTRTALEFDLDDHLAAARKLCAETSPQALLTTHAALTHRIHASEDDELSADLRAQRDIVEAELLRRMSFRAPTRTITETDLNVAAQRAYDHGIIRLPRMTDKPKVVAMLRDVLGSLGVPVPPEQQ
jgi:hypothetical protein